MFVGMEIFNDQKIGKHRFRVRLHHLVLLRTILINVFSYDFIITHLKLTIDSYCIISIVILYYTYSYT